jgi:hypothetical protein
MPVNGNATEIFLKCPVFSLEKPMCCLSAIKNRRMFLLFIRA